MATLFRFLLETQDDFRRARLPSLYSDFRIQRTTNPDGYAANIQAWEKGLAAAAKAGYLQEGTLLIHLGSKLEEQLQSADYGRPQALDRVVEESVEHGHMLPLSDFKQSSRSIYDRNWNLNLSDLSSKVLTWALQQSGLMRKTRDPAQKYVIVSNLEDAGEVITKVLATKTRRVDRIIPMTCFRQVIKDNLKVANINQDDFDVILKFLSRDKVLIAYDEETVKVMGPTEGTPSVSQEDSNISRLKLLISDLAAQTSAIEARIQDLNLKAREAVARKSRAEAQLALRTKKLQEGLLIRRSEVLGQLEAVYSKIEEAVDQVEVVQAMQGSTQVLRALNKETGGAESVENMLESLQEEMSEVEQVRVALDEHSQLTSGMDDEAVNDELRRIEGEAKAEQEQREMEAVQQKLKELDAAKLPADVDLRGTAKQTSDAKTAIANN